MKSITEKQTLNYTGNVEINIVDLGNIIDGHKTIFLDSVRHLSYQNRFKRIQ